MSLYESFRQILLHVAGQAFDAAGYQLQDNPMHQARGLFRYRKALSETLRVYVEFQVLFYQQGGPSRFRVNLLRSSGADARADGATTEERTLAALVWEDFGARVLSGPDHWWLVRNEREVGFGIAEAGKLIFGFGIPWLEGTLTVPPAHSKLPETENSPKGDIE